MAFASFRDGDYEVYVARGDATEAVNITNNEAWDIEPQLSPDGTQILFLSDRDHPPAPNKDPIYNIYVANADGANLRRLTTTNDTQSRPSWSPDGSRILFAMVRNRNTDIYSIASDGTDLKRLTTSSAVDFDPTYMPDGSAILWVSEVSSTYGRLMMANPDGSDPAPMPIFPGPKRYLQHPLVSPTSAQIAFESDEDGNGWLDVGVFPLHPSATNPYYIYGVEIGEPTVAGWSPAVPETMDDPTFALWDRTLIVTSLEWTPAAEPGSFDLASAVSFGEGGWGGASSFSSSPFDFGFHAVALDHSAPFATTSAARFMHYAQGELGYTTADEGGSGVAQLIWQAVAPPENTLIAHFGKSQPGPSGTQEALFPQGVDAVVQAQAVDLAGNVGPLSAPIQTSLFVYRSSCTLTDPRGLPVEGASVDYRTPPFAQLASDAQGVAVAYFGRIPDIVALQATQPVFGVAPAASSAPTFVDPLDPYTIDFACTTYFRALARDAVINGRFEDTPSDTGWQFENGCAPALGGERGHLLQLGNQLYQGCPSDGPHRASQAIAGSLTATMHKPTLAFVYAMPQIYSPPTPEDEPVWPLRVSVTEAGLDATSPLTVTTVFTHGFHIQGETLAWVDMTPWAGRDITITFDLSETAGLPASKVLLDEISMTPWETPVVHGAALAAESAAVQPATLVITGENFITTPTVSLVTDAGLETLTLAAPSTETELRVVWPSGNAPGRYRVRVANPSGLYSEFNFMVNLPITVFLPLTHK